MFFFVHTQSKGSSNVKIVAGDHTIYSTEGSEQNIRVSRDFVHPQYNSRTMINDIALLKLSKDIKFDSYTQPACLPKRGELTLTLLFQLINLISEINIFKLPYHPIKIRGWTKMKAKMH